MKLISGCNRSLFALFIGIALCLGRLKSPAQSLQDGFPSVENSTGMTRIAELSLSGNPAQIAGLDSSLLAAFYTPSRFGLGELGSTGLFAGRNIAEGLGSAVQLSVRGGELYSELSTGLHGAADLTDKIAGGISLQYLRMAARNYAPSHAFVMNVGGILRLSDFFSAGFVLKNITRASYSQNSKNIAQEASFGIGAKMGEGLFLDADARILFAQASGISLALRYDALETLRFRIAASTVPRIIEAAVAADFPFAGVRGELSYHDLLGFSERIGLVYAW